MAGIGRQPGACSRDEGSCLPDSARCEIGYACNPDSCSCEEVKTFPCSADPSHLSCSPDNTQCQSNEYCDSQCECAPRINCNEDPNAATCSPIQNKCPVGWYCPAKSSSDIDACYCYQSIPCDGNTATLACDPDNTLCPANYTCDGSSNCTCQPAAGTLVDSTYSWTFNTFSQRPKVVEMCNRTSACRPEAISSPAPYSLDAYNNLDGAHQKLSAARPDDGEVPIDAIVAWQFSQRMNPATLAPDNFLMAECALSGQTLDCGETNEVPHTTEVADCNYQSRSAFYSHCGKLWPTALLKPDTYYRVLLKNNNILGENGLSLMGNYNNYFEWYFKTRNSDELSQVACLHFLPGGSTLYSYDQRQKYKIG